MFGWLIPSAVQAAFNALQQRQASRVASPWGSFAQFAQSPLGMGALGLLIGRAFPNAFAAPGSGYERAMLNAMLSGVSQQGDLLRRQMALLARIPPPPSLAGALDAQAQANAERMAERAIAGLPVGVQLPGLRERVRSGAYATMREPSLELLQREATLPYEQSLRALQMLAGIGGQAGDLAQQYGYLAQLWGQRGNMFYGALPQLLAGLWQWELERRRK